MLTVPPTRFSMSIIIMSSLEKAKDNINQSKTKKCFVCNSKIPKNIAPKSDLMKLCSISSILKDPWMFFPCLLLLFRCHLREVEHHTYFLSIFPH
mmetsp:Transcript_22235/g.45008  ORF Transcript_22235/g.45008 Transcript_22235/m.45008 type:complete len:95 (+) Transcript_22235:140-424(+)